ncbi:hypothetical protein ACFYPN_33080 [Streptomyces sp. NPDC005576]|uniref:hypothetical protein n=1 Tax=Streptomyces sp. NPDC005576 TaxID=3364726 RepID=UPI00367FF378
MTETLTTAVAQGKLGRPAPGCLIPECDAQWHSDDTCSNELGEVTFDTGGALAVEHVAITGHQPYIVAYSYESLTLGLRRQMTNPEQVRDFAQQLRALAGQLDNAAHHLAVPAPGEESTGS